MSGDETSKDDTKNMRRKESLVGREEHMTIRDTLSRKNSLAYQVNTVLSSQSTTRSSLI